MLIEPADDARIAGWLEDRIVAALDKGDGDVAICVPGGGTPMPILQRLATAKLDWARVVVWPGDDRLVPESHPASNVGRIRERLEPAGARIVPLAQGAQPPRFALTWLGMGDDGHIASLFPSTDPAPDDPVPVRTLTPDPLPPEAPFDRITMTIPTLLDADEVLFVVRGDDKVELFKEAAAGRNDRPVARLLQEARQPVTCFT